MTKETYVISRRHNQRQEQEEYMAYNDWDASIFWVGQINQAKAFKTIDEAQKLKDIQERLIDFGRVDYRIIIYKYTETMEEV